MAALASGKVTFLCGGGNVAVCGGGNRWANLTGREGIYVGLG